MKSINILMARIGALELWMTTITYLNFASVPTLCKKVKLILKSHFLPKFIYVLYNIFVSFYVLSNNV